MNTLNLKLLRQLVRHEPETGKLFWLHRSSELFATVHSCKRWNTNFAGKEALTASDNAGYLAGSILKTKLKAHRIVWALHHGEWPSGHIDHINGFKSDNRIKNLRVVTQAENNKNMRLRKDNASGAVGVYWHITSKKWGAYIGANGKATHLGLFSDVADAVAARKTAEKNLGFHPNHGRAA